MAQEGAENCHDVCVSKDALGVRPYYRALSRLLLLISCSTSRIHVRRHLQEFRHFSGQGMGQSGRLAFEANVCIGRRKKQSNIQQSLISSSGPDFEIVLSSLTNTTHQQATSPPHFVRISISTGHIPTIRSCSLTRSLRPIG